VEPQVRATTGLLERMMDADSGVLVAGIGESGQPVGGRLVQSEQAVLAGSGDVHTGARLVVRYP
jgi:hypothetical protein